MDTKKIFANRPCRDANEELNQIRLLLRPALALRLGKWIHLRRRFHALFAAQQAFNRQNLDLG
jgi:hypothetical protein